MQKESKQSGAKVIASFEKRFRKSLLRLTFLYALTLAIILSISSIIGYSAFSSRIRHRFEHVPPPTPLLIQQNDRPTASQVRKDFLESLIVVNGILIILAAILSYQLAKLTLRPIKRAYNQQREFFSNASHELRTPLSILQLDLENELSDKNIPEAVQRRAASNLEEVSRMSRLVGDLLLLSRLDENAVRNIRTERTNIEKVITDSIDSLGSLAKAHGITVSFEKPNRLYVTEADSALLFQAVENVLKNAIIYNHTEGTVQLTLRGNDAVASITITDSGIGISPEDVKKVFERFYRSDESRSRQTGGSGLGLSIVKSSMEHLRGTVSIESIKDTGTTITLTLPLL